MKRTVFGCIIIFSITSCVSQRQYQDLESSYYNALDEQANTQKELNLANLKVENTEKELELAKSELYRKDTALSNTKSLLMQMQKKSDDNLQKLYSALNSSGEKSKLFYNQLNDKEKLANELAQKVKELESQIEIKDTEIFNLKKQILTLEINKKVSESTEAPPISGKKRTIKK